MNRYKGYTDELLLYVYIFRYPYSRLKEQLALHDELERRGLADWASHMLSELCNIFEEKVGGKREVSKNRR